MNQGREASPAQNKAGFFLPLIISRIEPWYKQGKGIVGGTEREQTARLGMQKDCIYCRIAAKFCLQNPIFSSTTSKPTLCCLLTQELSDRCF